MIEKPRHRVKAGSTYVPVAPPRARAGYMRDSQSGVIAARPASLREHRDEIRRIWWRASALAMDMLQNSGRLRGTADQILADTVGVELQLNPRPDLARLGYSASEAIAWVRLVKARFKAWAWNPLECDFRAKFTIPQQTDIGIRHWLAFGESIGIVAYLHPQYRLPGTRTGTKLLLLSPQNLVQDTSDIERMYQGVIHDDHGRPTHYRIEKKRGWLSEKIDYPIRDADGRVMLMHAFDPFASDDVRGLSPLVPAFRKYLMAENTDEAAATVRFMQTLYAGVLKSKRPAAEAFEAFENFDGVEGVAELKQDFVDYFKAQLNRAAENEIRIGAGAGITQLAPDEDLEFKSISVPGDDYPEFMARLDRDTARALGVTSGGYTLDFSKATYASTNMENSGLWPIAQRRTDRIAAPHVLVPYASWLDEEIARGDVPFKGGYEAFVANRDAILWALCQGPSKPTADDEKRARGSSERMANGTGMLERECGELGDDAEEVFESRVYWHKRYLAEGMASPFDRGRPSDPAGKGRDGGVSEQAPRPNEQREAA